MEFYETDNLVLEYLAYRGFSETVTSFHRERKEDKLKELSSDSICNEVLQLTDSGKLEELIDLWNFLDDRCFRKCATTAETSIELKHGFLKLIMVNSSLSSNRERIIKVLKVLDGKDSEMMRWFALPFCSNPHLDPMFMSYFEDEWKKSLYISMRNFVSQVFRDQKAPKLLLFPLHQKKMKALEAQTECANCECALLREEISKLKILFMNRNHLSKYKDAKPIENELKPPAIAEEPKREDSDKLQFIGVGEHSSKINRCRISPDGLLVASASDDGTVRLWETKSSKNTLTQQQLIFCMSSALSIDWKSPDDRLLAIGTSSNSVLLWNSDKREMVSEIFAVSDAIMPHVTDVQFCERNHLLSSTSTGQSSLSVSSTKSLKPSIKFEKDIVKHSCVRLWNVNTTQLVSTLYSGSEFAINASSFNHNGSLVVTGGDDGRMRVYDVSKGSCIMEWSTSHPVHRLCLSTDETSVVCLSPTGFISIWSLHRVNDALLTFPATAAETYPACGDIICKQNVQNEFLACSSAFPAGEFQLLDSSTANRNTLETAHTNFISSLDWYSQGENTLLCTGSKDHTVRLYQPGL